MTNQNTKPKKILVAGSGIELPDMVREIAGGACEVTQAKDLQQGIDMARQRSPQLVIIGSLEPRGAAFHLYQKLHEGWLTRNIPLLIIDTDGQIGAAERAYIPADDYLASPTTLKDILPALLRKRANALKEAVQNPDTFAVTWEQIPGRGAFEPQQEELIENTRRAAKSDKIHGISVTDNPGGNPAISTEMLCTEIKKMGIEPLVHMALRDKNRNECESLLYGLIALNVHNVLMLTGDYPATSAFGNQPKPVFDLDSVHALQLVNKMNRGIEQEAAGKKTTLAATDFFAGAAISPFKAVEAELIGQYIKLKKKIETGAGFLITQVGYDARKLHEVLQWLKSNNYNIPVLANIYILPYGAARVMNAGQIPGCVVTDKLLAMLDEERKAKDKGKQTRLDRAAKTYAIAKGMGYAGAHIGGHGITYETVEYIINKGNELAPKWQELLPEFDFPQKDGFYLFLKDDKTGLNTDKLSDRTSKPTHPFVYGISRAAHATVFNPKSLCFKSFYPVAKSVDRSHVRKNMLEGSEHMAKVALFGCQNCGDCGLFDVAFICPISQCPKNQRNGPCGGSLNGWCEVYPNEQQCIWVRAYDRMKAHGEEESYGEYIVPPNDWALRNTSSWLNYYCGRDHSAKRLGIKPPAPKKKPESETKAPPAGEKKA